MFMAPGFAMLESGMVSSKSVASIATKNIGLFAIAGIMFWLGGYNQLMVYLKAVISVHSFHGAMVQNLIRDIQMDQIVFQMVFCATTVSIVSGALAERIKIWPFFVFAAILTGLIYPIQMGWQWGLAG